MRTVPGAAVTDELAAPTVTEPPEPDGGSGVEGPDPSSIGGPALLAAWIRTTMVVFGLAVAVATMRGREWLGPRAWSMWGLVIVGGVIIWQWPRSRAASCVVAVVGFIGATLAVASARTLPEPEATELYAEFARFDPALLVMERRLVADDIAPTSVLLLGGLWASIGFGGLALAALARRAAPLPRDLAGCLVVFGLVPSLVVLLVGVVGVDEVRRWADRRLEERVVTTTEGDAHRIGGADRIGVRLPAPPVDRAWGMLPLDVADRVIPVPGWDVVITTEGGLAEPISSVSAVSTADGSTVWRHTRWDGSFQDLAVDAEAGRVMLLGQVTILILDLADGHEVAARRSSIGRFGRMSGGAPGRWVVATGRSGEADGRVAVLDVATGATVATAGNPHIACTYEISPSYSERPVIFRWGAAGSCRQPTLLTVDGARLVPVVEIEAPPDTWAGCGNADDGACDEPRLLGDARSSVIALAWNPTDPGAEPVQEIVRVADGRVRWRAAVRGAPPQGPRLVALTDDAVVAEWGVRWRALALDTGAETASAPSTTVDELSVTRSQPLVAGNRAHTADCGRLVVRDLDDLAVVAEWDLHPAGCATPIERPAGTRATLPVDLGDSGSATLATSDGRLVVRDHRTATVEVYEHRGPADGGDPPRQEGRGEQPAPVTLAELRDLPAPASEADALPAACRSPDGTDATDSGLPPDTDSFHYDDDVPDANGDGAPDSMLLADVDGDGVDDGIASFTCASAGVHPPTGVLVLLAADRALVSSDPGEIQARALETFRDHRHVVHGAVRHVPAGPANAGHITVETLASLPEDPNCCPSVPAVTSFVLRDGRLRVTDVSPR